MFEIASRNLDVIHAVKFCPAKICAVENIVVVQEFVAGVFFFLMQQSCTGEIILHGNNKTKTVIY